VRYLFPLLFVCFLLPTAAEASYRPAQYYHQQYRVDYHQQYRVARQMQAAYTARYVYRESQWGGRQRAPASHRHYGGYGHYSGACAIAAAKGGPCGCEAMKLSGLSDRRYWLVSNWRVFPRTSAHVGAAALWGNQHVEIVTAVNGDGTVNTAGSVGHSHVRIASLTFVDPHAGAGGVSASSAPASNAAEARAPVARAPAASARLEAAARRSRYTVRASNRYRYASAFRRYAGRATFMRSIYRESPQDRGWANDYSSGRSL
jgi:hypothetical protein